MYEFSLTNSVNNAVQDICRQAGWNKVSRILLKVGSIRKINPELMAFIFAALSKDTPAEGAILSVMIFPVIVKCGSCGRTSTREDSEFLCASCGSRDVELVSGLELAIESLEVESGFHEHES